MGYERNCHYGAILNYLTDYKVVKISDVYFIYMLFFLKKLWKNIKSLPRKFFLISKRDE